MTRRHNITQAAIARVVKGAQAAGLKVGRVEVEGTRIVIHSSEATVQEPASEFDAWRAKRDRRTRGEFMAWRDRLAIRSRRQADYAWSVLARILSWALERGLVLANPCERGGRLYRAERTDKVWTDDDEARFLASAPKHLRLP